jgi:hypothetical protein
MLILPHLKGLTAGNIGSAVFKNASLDLKFADNKSLVDAVTGASLITFTRASSGTYVDSAGVLQTAVTNLLLRSEEFDNASWNVAPLILTVTANTQTAPNGTLTADTITTVSGTSALFQTVACVASTVYTWSFYVKLGTMAATDFRFAVRDDSNGAFIAAEIVPNVTPVTTEWRRVTYTFTTPVGCVLVRPYPYRAAPATYGTTAFLWGAQLEQSATVGEYIPTTSAINSAPRFDHNPTTGESLGLLVEEQRTNLMGNSGVLTATPNWLGTNATVAASGTAPDGNSAYAITENTVTSAHSFVNCGTAGVSSTSITSGTIYTGSIFLKKSTDDWVQLTFGAASFGSSLFINFNLATGNTGNSAGCTGTITPFRDGWYRCTITATATSTALSNNLILSFTNNTNTTSRTLNYAGSTTQKFFAALGQFEASAFASSYTPTTTAAATRSADVASITGTAFSGWYRQDEGTVYGEGSTFNTGASSCLVSIDDTTSSNRIQLRRSTSASTLRMVSSGGSIDANLTTGTALGTNKIATGISANNQNLVSNGVIATGITSITPMPTVTQAQIGNGPASNIFNGTIRRLAYWGQRLPNNVLQAITQ